jgi:hypothetical protein
MGLKPRKKPEAAWDPDPIDKDGLIAVDGMDVTGKHKTAGILTPLVVGEAIEVKMHRRLHDHEITAMNIVSIDFRRLGRGRAAMEPGGLKQMIIKVKYRDGS